MYVHRSLIDGCQVLGLVADSDLGYCPYTGSPDVTNAAWLGFLLYPVCDALLNPIFRWMGALHRISVYVLPTAGECTTASRTVPLLEPLPLLQPFPPGLWLLRRLCLLHRLWLPRRLRLLHWLCLLHCGYYTDYYVHPRGSLAPPSATTNASNSAKHVAPIGVNGIVGALA